MLSVGIKELNDKRRTTVTMRRKKMRRRIWKGNILVIVAGAEWRQDSNRRPGGSMRLAMERHRPPSRRRTCRLAEQTKRRSVLR
jgi:hypothetical protein